MAETESDLDVHTTNINNGSANADKEQNNENYK